MPTVSLADLADLAASALERAGANPDMAAVTAQALVEADAEGLSSHGVSRVPRYASHLRNGRADGAAIAQIVSSKGAAFLVDAKSGLAFPACALAVQTAIGRARELGVSFAGVTNSHHFGVAAYHLRPVAMANMVGLAFGNSPAAMPVAGGKHAVLGTNPVAAIFPRRHGAPLTIDLSLSEVARGKVMIAAREGKPIPLGWAVDRAGNPTTDARAALEGSMLALGGIKGSMLALIVEVLSCALTGAQLGFEADSFLEAEGNQPRVGQAFLVIDPAALAGWERYLERIESLVSEMLKDPGVRLPGYRRDALAGEAIAAGVTIPDALYDELARLARA